MRLGGERPVITHRYCCKYVQHIPSAASWTLHAVTHANTARHVNNWLAASGDKVSGGRAVAPRHSARDRTPLTVPSERNTKDNWDQAAAKVPSPGKTSGLAPSYCTEHHHLYRRNRYKLQKYTKERGRVLAADLVVIITFNLQLKNVLPSSIFWRKLWSQVLSCLPPG